MKKSLSLFSLVSVAFFASISAFAEICFVVTTTDFTGQKEFSAMSKEEFKEHQKKINLQNKLLPKVLKEIEADFRKNPTEHEGEKYYGNKLKPKKIKSAQMNDLGKAQEKVDKMQEKADNEEVKAMKGGKGKKKLSESEKEKLYKQAEKEAQIYDFAKTVEKMIDEKIKDLEEKN